jgi:hypothetical protein
MATYGIAFTPETVVLSIIAVSFYCLLAVVAYRKAGAALREVSMGGVSKGRIGLLKEIDVEVTTPLRALIKKDIKLATKNVGSAFVFVIPLFLVFMLYPMISFWGGGVRSMTALVAVQYANVFSGLSIVSILMFDSQGASIQEGLPQSTRMTLNAKTAIALPIYLVSLALIFVLLALQPLITPLIILIPIVQVPAGYALSLMVGGVVYKLQGGGRAVAISFTGNSSLVIISGIVAFVIGIIPLVGYGLTMILTGDHIFCLVIQLLLSVLLAVFADRSVSRLLKD